MRCAEFVVNNLRASARSEVIHCIAAGAQVSNLVVRTGRLPMGARAHYPRSLIEQSLRNGMKNPLKARLG